MWWHCLLLPLGLEGREFGSWYKLFAFKQDDYANTTGFFIHEEFSKDLNIYIFIQVDNFVPTRHYYFITIVWSWKAIISKRIATWWQTYRWKVIVVSKCYAVGHYHTRTHARTRALPETRWWHWLSVAVMRVISVRYGKVRAAPTSRFPRAIASRSRSIWILIYL